VGNAVVIGHRRRYGATFGDLPDVEKGAEVAVQTRSNQVRTYVVSSVRRARADDTTILRPTRRAQLTLVTAGDLTGRHLLVVVARPRSNAASTAVPVGRVSGHLSASALDERPTSGLAALLLVAVVASLGGLAAVGAVELRRRYSAWATAMLVVPVIAAFSIVVVLSLDSIVPTTFEVSRRCGMGLRDFRVIRLK
jgi:hypothetical protein